LFDQDLPDLHHGGSRDADIIAKGFCQDPLDTVRILADRGHRPIAALQENPRRAPGRLIPCASGLDYRTTVGDGQPPGFALEQRAALHDFWTVYERLIERLQETAIEVAVRQPDFAPLARAYSAEQLAEQARESRRALRIAFGDGDWRPYIEQTRAFGATCAELGIGFTSWYEVTRVLQQRLIPALVDAYAAAPVRLAAALVVATEFLDFSMALTVEQYIAKRKRIETTLEHSTRQLERANRELDAFSSSVAHELRAPLRGVTGFTQILLEDHAAAVGPEVASYLTRIQSNVKRMGALIDALLGLARLSRVELERMPVDLSAQARTVFAQLAASEPHRVVDVSIQDGLHAAADPRLVRTLLENLISNAWKFTAQTASPRIAFGSDDGRTLFVRDNGVGFDPERAGKLFSPFERLHNAEDFPGTGIGLATVQRVVHRHGGRIWAKAEVDAGATFFFTLAPDQNS
jgi:signal transduction histidine kinase